MSPQRDLLPIDIDFIINRNVIRSKKYKNNSFKHHNLEIKCSHLTNTSDPNETFCYAIVSPNN